MKMSDTISQLATALAKAQGEIAGWDRHKLGERRALTNTRRCIARAGSRYGNGARGRIGDGFWRAMWSRGAAGDLDGDPAHLVTVALADSFDVVHPYREVIVPGAGGYSFDRPIGQ